MTILEIIVCVLVVISVIKGYRKGLSGQILKVVGLVAGGFAAVAFKDTFSPRLQGWFPSLGEKVAAVSAELVPKLYAALAFIVIWLAVIVVAWVLSLLVKSKQGKSSSLDKSLGVLLSLAIWVVILSCLLTLYNLIPTDNETLTNTFAPINKQINEGLFLKYLASPSNPIGKLVIKLFN